ncbi:IS66 family transposase [Myxococcus sp. SDU36]|uniref:IS66 family transposase n=1 Tax=Myxococcus sp. SDU36 TaxID=2831967 RepID=UPI002543AEBF|nr:IS66 family transposase [Myxococcus sp. SDU36]WIG93032.1 IS66 family transposase [Myxococcus sp. SDU36]
MGHGTRRVVAEVDPKDARIAELERQVEELTRLVQELREQLRRNSVNSNRPPSSDTPGQKAERRKQSGSGKKRGGQPGHKGLTRALVAEEKVSEFKHLFPSACENCWTPLSPEGGTRVRRYQSVELPPLKAHVTQWVRHGVECPRCNHETWASTAPIPASPFGPRLSAVVGLLTGVYHLSRRSAVRLLGDVLGIDISLGAVSAVEARVSEAVKPAVDEAWAQVLSAPVKHTDGTQWLEGCQARALWTIASSMATVFKILTDGKSRTLAALFGLKLGVLVSDRATALNFWAMEARQVCWAHLLRKAISFSERDGPAGAIGREFLDYIGILFDYWGRLRSGELQRDTLQGRMAPVRAQVEALLERAVAARLPHVSGSCEDILEHRAALWTFVDREGVEPTNNHAERELRAFVLWRKRSFGTQSTRGNLFAERVMTVAHTARKQEKNVLEFLTACCTTARTGAPPPSLFAAP